MNNLEEVETKCKALMTAHGVGYVKFRFSKAWREIACVHGVTFVKTGVSIPTELTLSRKWALVLPDNDLLEVMLHEIAHIMTIDEEKEHGPRFAATVRSLGGKSTRRCYLPSVNLDGSPAF